ncbi:restriction endonuclease [Streptomyces sp. NPDC039022]|uniref:McrC family protein n=1 Tax=Streptomyces sp. NPDC039022 TaxID=3157091 RepID=UPI0033FF757C
MNAAAVPVEGDGLPDAGLPLIELVEHGGSIPLRLDDATGRALAASGAVEAVPDAYLPGLWHVTAGRKVGTATVAVRGEGAVMVRILPKVPIARLLFLLGYSLHAKGWRDEDVQVSGAEELLPAVARLFERQAEKALRQGLLQGYRTVEETSVVVRGRMRQGDQIRRHNGRQLPMETLHDEYTTDIPENQLLRTACERLLRLPSGGLPSDVRGRLLRLRVRLADVTVVGRGHPLPEWRPSRLNVRYRPALRLAELVLQGASVEHRPGEVTVSGFLFDMPKVFEDFVTVALREALVEAGGYCRLQASHHLDERAKIRMVPDFVHYADDGTPTAVADAKYKAEKRGGFPDADLYQMLAYCTVLGLPEGHLVYAEGNAPHATHRVRRAGTTIHQHALELDQPPSGLLTEVRALAGRLAAPASV